MNADAAFKRPLKNDVNDDEKRYGNDFYTAEG